jgi:hypothetical protein
VDTSSGSSSGSGSGSGSSGEVRSDHITSVAREPRSDATKESEKRKPIAHSEPVKVIPQSIWKPKPTVVGRAPHNVEEKKKPTSKADKKRQTQLETVDGQLMRLRMEIGEIDSRIAADQYRKTQVNKEIKRLMRKQSTLSAAMHETSGLCLSVEALEVVLGRVFPPVLSLTSSNISGTGVMKASSCSYHPSPLWTMSHLSDKFDRMIAGVGIDSQTGVISGIGAKHSQSSPHLSQQLLPNSPPSCSGARSNLSTSVEKSPSLLSQFVHIIDENRASKDVKDSDPPKSPLSVESILSNISAQIQMLESLASLERQSHDSSEVVTEGGMNSAEIIEFCAQATEVMNKLNPGLDCKGGNCAGIDITEERLVNDICSPSNDQRNVSILHDTPIQASQSQQQFTIDLDLDDIIGQDSPQDTLPKFTPEGLMSKRSSGSSQLKDVNDTPSFVRQDINDKSVDELCGGSATTVVPTPVAGGLNANGQDSGSHYLNDSDTCLDGVLHYLPSPTLSPLFQAPASTSMNSSSMVKSPATRTEQNISTRASRHIQNALASFSTDCVLSGDDGFQYDAVSDSDDNNENNFNSINNDSHFVLYEDEDHIHINDACPTSISNGDSFAGDLHGNTEDSLLRESNSHFNDSGSSLPLDILAVPIKMPNLSNYSDQQIFEICGQYGLKQTGPRSKLEKLLTTMWGRLHGEPIRRGNTDSSEPKNSNGNGTSADSCMSYVKKEVVSSQDASGVVSRNTVLTFIRSDTRIYEDVLTFVPLDINVLQSAMKNSNIRVSKVELQRILDEEGIFSSSIGNKRKLPNSDVSGLDNSAATEL